jgi:hypothetical protein
VQEEDNDEIQLCNIPTKIENNSQRSHVEYFARTYQTTSNASSPRLDSWQDASTEPITPLKGDGLPIVYSPPPSRQLKKHPFPSSPNPIESPPRRLFQPTFLKRKTEETEMSPQPVKKLSRLSTNSKKMSIATIVEQQPVDPSPSQPKVTTIEKVPEPVVAPIVKDTTHIQDKSIETVKEVEPKLEKEKSETSSNRKLTKEEEAVRIAEEITHLMKTVKSLPNYYKLIDKIGEGKKYEKKVVCE